jgi:hypothetical protein
VSAQLALTGDVASAAVSRNLVHAHAYYNSRDVMQNQPADAAWAASPGHKGEQHVSCKLWVGGSLLGTQCHNRCPVPKTTYNHVFGKLKLLLCVCPAGHGTSRPAKG